MSGNYRQKLIASFTFFGGLYFFLEFVLPKKIGEFQFGYYHEQALTGLKVFSLMAVGLGLINILRVHGSRILKTQKGWGNSLALILGLFAVMAIEGVDFQNSQDSVAESKEISNLVLFIDRVQSDHIDKQVPGAPRIAALQRTLDKVEQNFNSGHFYIRPSANSSIFTAQLSEAKLLSAKLREQYLERPSDTAETTKQLATALKALASTAREIANSSYEETSVNKIYRLFYIGLFVPLGSAMFSLLAFYIANAAYRSFRVKSLEAFLMMFAAVIVTLGQIPHGPLYISEDLPAIRLWLIQNVSTPAFRAITFGSLIAGLAMAVRILLSLEQSPLDINEGKSGGKS